MNLDCLLFIIKRHDVQLPGLKSGRSLTLVPRFLKMWDILQKEQDNGFRFPCCSQIYFHAWEKFGQIKEKFFEMYLNDSMRGYFIMSMLVE